MSCASIQSDGSDSVGLLISKEQRDLLVDRILFNLARTDAILDAVRVGELVKADRLSRFLRDGLTLVVNDLGWVADDGDRSIEVSTPPLIVRGLLEYLRAEAKALDPYIDLRDAAAANRELVATCDQLLVSLEAQQTQGTVQRAAPLPFGDLKEDQLVKKEILRLLMRAHPAEIRDEQISASVSSTLEVPEATVERAIGDLQDMDLVTTVRSGRTASEGAMCISQLWNDLSDLA
jgi:hypothetical protein